MSRLRGRFFPPGGRRPTPRPLRPAAEHALGGATFLASTPSRLRAGRARAVSGGRLAGRDGFGFVLVWPVLEGSGKPGAACFTAGLAASRLGGVLHMDRPQNGVLLVVLDPVGDEAALHVRPAGRPKQRILSKERAD